MAKQAPAEAPPVDWSEAILLFAAHLVEGEKSPQTIRAYRGDLKLYGAWYHDTYAEPPTLELVTAAELRAWKNHQVDAKHAPQTVNRRLAAMQAILKWAQSKEWCHAVQGPRSVRQEAPIPRWLNRREQLALVRAVERARIHRDIALIKLLLHAGFRIAEVASLRWTALELSPRKGTVTVTGKGRKTRTIPLNAEARAALIELANGWKLGKDRPVFEGREGGLTANGLWRVIKTYGALAKLDCFGPHVCRHTFCRRLAEAGTRLEVIAALAGHESIETTRRYVEPGQEDFRAAVELLAGGED